MRKEVVRDQKLLSFLRGELRSQSNKSIKKLLDLKLVKINGQIERFGSRDLNRGDSVEIASNWKSFTEKEIPKIETMYEDNDLLIINKPPFFESSQKNIEKIFGKEKYLIHRLDKETSGLLMIAKSEEVKADFIQLFKQKMIEKRYLAIVDGMIFKEGGLITSYLAKKKSFSGQTIFGSSQSGLYAETQWKKISAKNGATLVECIPVTGRTHQLRVHFAEMNHPILADRQYAKNFSSKIHAIRIMLHAYLLQFEYKGKKIEVSAPLFFDIRDIWMHFGFEMGEFGQLFREDN